MIAVSSAARVLSHPPAAARAARLRYLDDTTPGLRRLAARGGFRYVNSRGRPVRDPAVLGRIRALAIPPAWTDVWICPRPHGHLQATGRDARGRKQYLYHERWRDVRDGAKFGRLAAFGRALPALRTRVEADLSRPGLPLEKVLAAVVRLLEVTHVRVGNEEYARQNHSFGLTTLRTRHVAVNGSTVNLRFRGKSGVPHDVAITDRKLARLVRRCQELPGQDLFAYLDGAGQCRRVSSQDVNDYLRQSACRRFTAKDFRTWAGTVLAARELAALPPPTSKTLANRALAASVTAVAERLRNTRPVCRRCYIHPAVIESFRAGTLASELKRPLEHVPGLDEDEAAILAFLRRRT